MCLSVDKVLIKSLVVTQSVAPSPATHLALELIHLAVQDQHQNDEDEAQGGCGGGGEHAELEHLQVSINVLKHDFTSQEYNAGSCSNVGDASTVKALPLGRKYDELVEIDRPGRSLVSAT